MKVFVVSKADGIFSELESVEIKIVQPVAFDLSKSIDDIERFYQDEAAALADALLGSLPQGTIDRLLAVLKERRAGPLAERCTDHALTHYTTLALSASGPARHEEKRIMNDKLTAEKTEFSVGEKVFVETGTKYFTGEVAGETPAFVILERAAWIADTGRFADAMRVGEFNEVEPYAQPIRVSKAAIVCWTRWSHKLPEEQK